MPRKPTVPSYRLQKKSGKAIVTLRDAMTGARHDVLLGPFDTSESRAEYQRVVLDWEASGRRFELDRDATADITIAELVQRYWRHVESYYRHGDGTQTGEVQAMRYSLRPINHLHGSTPARTFGPLALKAVREIMVSGYDHPEYGPQGACCRTLVNARVKRIRGMFRWAVSNELVPANVLQALQAVEPLKHGRTDARESEPVKPIARAVVDDTLPLLRPMLADMVRLQLESGMRSGELVAMRPRDIDMTGKVWIYQPPSHKTQHHGHQRIISLGPKCQAIVRKYLSTDLQACLFSPRKMMEQRAAARRRARKTKVQPSQFDRRKACPQKTPSDVYTVRAYSKSIAGTIARHNAKAAEADKIPHWHPHQLRHTRALELKREAGLDVARAVLGHRSPAITEMYAGADMAKAGEVMARLG